MEKRYEPLKPGDLARGASLLAWPPREGNRNASRVNRRAKKLAQPCEGGPLICANCGERVADIKHGA